MPGLVTRNAPEVSWPEFNPTYYEVKSVSGRLNDPVEGAIPMISCFGDTSRAETNPDLVPVSANGELATRDAPYFDWSYICPTKEQYRKDLLDFIHEVGLDFPDVRIDDIGFPREEFCHCDDCVDQFENSDIDDRQRWRVAQINSFLQAVRERVPGELHVTVYPYPFPGHLQTRSGIDLERVADIADRIVVPLYDTAYETTYWLEAIANGFRSRLGDNALSIELYAANVEVDSLSKATSVAAAYADDVVFGYDAATARAVVRRRRAESSEGTTYRIDQSDPG